MAIGDNRFSRVGVDFGYLLAMHGITVSVSRIVQSSVTQRDIYGTPQNYTPTTFQANIVIFEQKLDETMVLAGGKPKEILRFAVTPGTLIENDDVTYGPHQYQVTEVAPLNIAGSDSLDMVTATRQVQV